MATYEAIKAGLAELRAEQEKMSQQIKAKAKEIFNGFYGSVFEEHPKLVAFSWTQYTPYFMDGDECIFSARTDDPSIQFGDEDEPKDFYFSDTERVADGTETVKSWNGRMETRTKYKSVPRIHTEEELEKNAAYKTVRDFLTNFSEDDLKAMFGDHQQITVTAQGVEAEGYDHD